MDAQKLAKVLAMAASDNDTEALHALRTARRLLDGHGSDFVELANRLSGGAMVQAEAVEDAVFDLRNEIRQLRAENERLRQGRPPTGPRTEPPSLPDAARDVAEMIRLRAELDGARAEALRLRAREATLQEQYGQALAEAGDLGLRLSEVDSRRMRLEAENRRLRHANHGLKVELAETQMLKSPPVTVSVLPALHTRGKKAPASTKGRGQYALF